VDIIIGVLEQSFIYGIMALGVYISYKILDFPDLSVDGTFPLGAAVSASILTHGQNPWLALLLSFIAGCVAGLVTGLLHVKLKIKDLLSGILMMTALYSVNYRIAGSPNIFLMGSKTIFNIAPASKYTSLIIVFLIAVGIKILMDLYLKTKHGFLLRATGDNEQLVVSLAQNSGNIKIFGLAMANGLVALAGAVNSQKIMQFDISSGVGTIVMGLAAVIIGTTLFRKLTFVKATTAVIIGMIVYKACIILAMNFGFKSSDMNLIITVLFIITLVISNFKRSGIVA